MRVTVVHWRRASRPGNRLPLFRTALAITGVATLLITHLGCHALKPGLPPVERADARPKAQEPTLPTKYNQRVSQFVIFTESQLKLDLPLLGELAQLPKAIEKELQLSSSDALVQVYLFEDRDRYEQFMTAKYPNLPRRRAFFVAQPRALGGPEDLLVLTFWGDRTRQDLLHELTHALLHSTLNDVPLWLDEGLAEYFELAQEAQGLHAQHFQQIHLAGINEFQPNLAHLEGLTQIADMSPAEYREAWAWTHLLLRSSPEAKGVLLQYLKELRTNPNPGPLRPRLERVFPDPEQALLEHLARQLSAGKQDDSSRTPGYYPAHAA